MNGCPYCVEDSGDVCRARRSPGGRYCTRPLGHEGTHVACGTDKHVVESWEQGSPNRRNFDPVNSTPKEQAANWNKNNPIGTQVTMTRDGGEVQTTRTSSAAWVAACGGAVVLMEGVRGAYLLDRVKPVKLTKSTPEEIVARINGYLQSGGLFNPEMVEHEKVRDLLLDCRDTLTKPKPKPPLGIDPEYLWKDRRIEALSEAIDRYVCGGFLLPCVTEWALERRKLEGVAPA